MSVKLLTEHNLELLGLTGGYTGCSESTLVKMPHCWKSRVVAHLTLLFYYFFTARGLEAAHILDQLQKEIIFLTGLYQT